MVLSFCCKALYLKCLQGFWRHLYSVSLYYFTYMHLLSQKVVTTCGHPTSAWYILGHRGRPVRNEKVGSVNVESEIMFDCDTKQLFSINFTQWECLCLLEKYLGQKNTIKVFFKIFKSLVYVLQIFDLVFLS